MDLASHSCEPCRGGVAPMTADEARALLPQAPGWDLSEDARKLTRRIKCANFRDAIALVNRIADVAEAEQHHPDLKIHGWNKVDLTLTTHKIGGLHRNDFILAAKLQKLLEV